MSKPFVIKILILIFFFAANVVHSQFWMKKLEAIALVKDKELKRNNNVKSITAMLMHIINSDTTWETLVGRCEYDIKGNKILEYLEYSNVSFEYDENDRMTSKQEIGKDSSIWSTTSYDYDSKGNLIQENTQTSSTLYSQKEFITSYTYDTLGNVTEMEMKSNISYFKTLFFYDEYGNINKNYSVDSNGKMSPIITHNLKYDLYSRLVLRELFSGGKFINKESYGYDNKDNIIEFEYFQREVKGYFGRPSKQIKKTYEYDEENNVIHSTESVEGKVYDDSKFKYDNDGLITKKIDYNSTGKPIYTTKYLYEYYESK